MPVAKCRLGCVFLLVTLAAEPACKSTTGAHVQGDDPQAETSQDSGPKGDDRDKEANPRFKELGKYARPIGRKRTEQEVRDSIQFAADETIKNFGALKPYILQLKALDVKAAFQRQTIGRPPIEAMNGLPGTGKSSYLKFYMKMRDKEADVSTETFDETTYDLPVDSIFRNARELGPGVQEEPYYDGLDGVAFWDEVDKAPLMPELEAMDAKLRGKNEKLIDARIDGEKQKQWSSGGTVEIDTDAKLVTPLTLRLGSIDDIWDPMGNGISNKAPKKTKTKYLRLLDELADRLTPIRELEEAGQQKVDAIRVLGDKMSDTDKTQMAEAQSKVADANAKRSAMIIEAQQLIKDMLIDFPAMFSSEQRLLSYRVIAQQLLAPNSTDVIIKGFKDRAPATPDKIQRDMRGTLVFMAMNGRPLRQVQEDAKKDGEVLTPAEAQKRLDDLPKDCMSDSFYGLFGTKQGVERRFGYEQFQRRMRVLTEAEWRIEVQRFLTNATKLVQKTSGSTGINLKFDAAVEDAVYRACVNGIAGFDTFRDRYNELTDVFLTELGTLLGKRENAAQLGELTVTFDMERLSFKVQAADPQALTWEFQPNVNPNAIKNPWVSNFLEPERINHIDAAISVVGAALFRAPPLSVTADYADNGRGVRSLWGQTDIPEAEYLTKVVITEMAGYAIQRETIVSLGIDERLMTNYERTIRIIDQIARDPIMAKNVLTYLESIKGDTQYKALEEVVPPQMPTTEAFKKVSGDEIKSKLIIAAYSHAARIVKYEDRFISDLAKELRLRQTISLEGWQKIAKESYYSAYDLATKRQLVEGVPGVPLLSVCGILERQVGIWGKASRLANRGYYNTKKAAREAPGAIWRSLRGLFGGGSGPARPSTGTQQVYP